MLPAPQCVAPLRPLALRAAILYVLLRLLLAAVSAIGAGSDAPSFDSPFGIVLLVTALGAIDIRRRGESMLWANLGYPTFVLWGIFGAVALVGELLLLLARA